LENSAKYFAAIADKLNCNKLMISDFFSAKDGAVMIEYLLNVEMDLYGPYHSEELARHAQYIFTAKHPDMKGYCSISPINPNSGCIALIDPKLLH